MNSLAIFDSQHPSFAPGKIDFSLSIFDNVCTLAILGSDCTSGISHCHVCRRGEREAEDRMLRPKLYLKRRTHVWKRQFSYQ